MDQVSNFITSLRNAGAAGHESVLVSNSKLKASIAQVLKNEKFIKDFEGKTVKGRSMLEVTLLSENRIPRINGMKRISKPSKRIYKKATELKPVKNGYGALIVSTSAGVMSGREAKKQKLGGEALFSIW